MQLKPPADATDFQGNLSSELGKIWAQIRKANLIKKIASYYAIYINLVYICLFTLRFPQEKRIFFVQKIVGGRKMKEMLRKWGLFSIILLLSMIMMIGCGTGETETQDKEDVTSTDKTEEAAGNGGEAFPVTITDGANREVTIEEEPETIVSIQASNTEIAFALGVGG